MSDTPITTITGHFSDLEDPRVEGHTDHRLIDIIVIAICAVICGADGRIEVEAFGRVFARLDPECFQTRFMDWVRSIEKVTNGQVIAINGKAVRRSHDRANGKEAIHMVSAWVAESRCEIE
jgi:hypothetical protein